MPGMVPSRLFPSDSVKTSTRRIPSYLPVKRSTAESSDDSGNHLKKTNVLMGANA